jgi:hypothetical protein
MAISIYLMGLLFLLGSCANVKFYSASLNSDGSIKNLNKTGLRVYTAKPYLLVEYNTPPDKDTASKADPKAAKDKAAKIDTLMVKTSIIYLPDLQNPQYIKLTPGLGSSDLKIALANGILTSYGLTTDTKIPETITAVTGLVTGLASAAGKMAVTKEVNTSSVKPKEKKPSFELYEICFDAGCNCTVLKPVKLN